MECSLDTPFSSLQHVFGYCRKEITMTRCIYPYNFSPLIYVQDADRARLVDCFALQGVSSVVPLSAWRRRGTWATTLPMGVFDNDYRPGVVTEGAHVAACAAIYEQDAALAKEFKQRARPHAPHLGARVFEGQLYYHVETLRFLRTQVPDPAFLNALYAFLLAATNDRTLIVPAAPRAPYVPHAQRKQVHGLKHVDMCRGPAWTPAEDAVLRRWFGMHTSGVHKGLHAAPSEAAWQQVLDVELAGRRTRTSVQSRFVYLNEQLLREFEVDGFVPITQVKAYMQRAVGIRPRRPPVRLTSKRRQRALTLDPSPQIPAAL